MADTTPRLPVTAEATDYAPYSFLAVLSLVAAGLFAVVLIVLGLSAWLAGQPLFEPELLILPLLALLLAFAARRQINNSEGTRVGQNLCGYAWWIAIVGGLGYAAYLFGIGFAIRQDAEGAYQRWAATLVKVNPLDNKNVELYTAFHGTLPPEKQTGLSPNDTAKIQSLYGAQMIAFRQSDIVRLAFRNSGDLRFEVVGLEEWKNDKNGVLNCKLTVRVHSPEGEYLLSAPMQRLTVKGRSEPTWQVVPPDNKSAAFLKSVRLNDYGEKLRDMELAAQLLVYTNFNVAIRLRAFQDRLFDEYGQPNPNPDDTYRRLEANELKRSTPWSAAIGGVAGLPLPPVDGYLALARKHFVPLDRGDPAREEEQRRNFARAWQQGLIASPRQIITENQDVGAIMVPGPKEWEIRVPVEIQPNLAERSQAAARAVVVCALDDPTFLTELKALKAKPGEMKDPMPRFSPLGPVPWRILRIESDMKIHIPPRQGPGGGM